MDINSIGGINNYSNYSDASGGLDGTVFANLQQLGNDMTGNNPSYSQVQTDMAPLLQNITVSEPMSFGPGSVVNYLLATAKYEDGQGGNASMANACNNAAGALRQLGEITTSDQFSAATEPNPQNYKSASNLEIWGSALLGLKNYGPT